MHSPVPKAWSRKPAALDRAAAPAGGGVNGLLEPAPAAPRPWGRSPARAVGLSFLLSVDGVPAPGGAAGGRAAADGHRRALDRRRRRCGSTSASRMDPLSAVMALVVTGVGFLIHVYSLGYMAHDEGFTRFFAYLNLFIFAMMMLVLGENLLLLFVGWEGVGLCSYLLIGFWFNEEANADRRQEGLRRQPHRRLRLPARASSCWAPRCCRTWARARACSASARCRRHARRAGAGGHGDRACCCSSARPASRRRSRSTSGCRTPWPARRRSAR